MTASVAAGASRDALGVDKGSGRSGTVQSIERAFGLLETMADHGGTMGLSQLAAESGLPLPTIHRLLRTLVDLGYLRQDASRQYVLAPRLIRLGESSEAMLSVWAKPHLDRLVAELGESANLAMLDGDEIVYVAQAQSRRSMRMFTEPGRRVQPRDTVTECRFDERSRLVLAAGRAGPGPRLRPGRLSSPPAARRRSRRNQTLHEPARDCGRLAADLLRVQRSLPRRLSLRPAGHDDGLPAAARSCPARLGAL